MTRVTIALFLLLPLAAQAANRFSVGATGTWFNTNRWSTACGGASGSSVPGVNDDVFICNGTQVDVDTASVTVRSVTVNNGGTLRFNSTTARTLTVSRATGGTGNVTVNNGGTFSVNNVTQSGHTLRLDGNLTNNGTFDMTFDGNSRALVEFNYTGGNQTLSGTGATTDFQQIRLNKGSINNILDVSGLSNLTFGNSTAPQITTTAGGAGTFRLSSALTLTDVLNDSIGADLRIWVNHASAVLSNGGGSLAIAAGGVLQVDLGTVNAVANLNPTGTVEVNGGTVTTTGNSGITGTFDINGGTTTIGGNVTVNSGGVLDVSAGTLNVNGGTGLSVVANGTMTVSGTGDVNVVDDFVIAGTANLNAGTTDITNTVSVNAGGVLEVNGGTFTVLGATLTINGGTFQVDGGMVNVGNANNERVILNNNAASVFEMNGGTLNIAGRFTSNNAAGAGTFTLNIGAINVGLVGNDGNSNLNSPFFIPSGAQFNMAGGTIAIQSDNTGGANSHEYRVTAISSNVTGGTVQIGNASTVGGEVFQIFSTPPLPNFTINATNNPAVTMLGDVSVLGNWTKDSTGTFTPGAFTVTMSASAAQTIGGTQSTTFNNLEIANTSGGVSLTQSQTVGNAGVGALTLTSGTLSVGANTLTLNGTAITGTTTNLSTTSSSNITIGSTASGHILPSSVANLNNLTVNNANGVTLNGSVTVAGTPGLTLTSGPVFTGTNTVTASVNCPNGVARTTGHVSGNLRMNFPAPPASCQFFLGDGTNYSPLTLNFSAITSGATRIITAAAYRTPTTLDHPNTTAGTSGITAGTSVNRYWSLKDSTIAGTAQVTFTYLLADNDVPGSVGSYAIRRGSGCAGTGSTRTCQPWLPLTVSGVPITTQAVASPVSIAVGANAELDMSIGVLDPAINFQRERQFIYTREQY